MSLINKLSKIAKAAYEEAIKPESFSKGEDFEKYVREVMFPKSSYELIHRSDSYVDNKNDYSENTLLPDFEFRCNKTKKSFYIEAKFRKGEYYQDKIEWCKPYQLNRYKAINKKTPVFLAFGIGDSPVKPEEVFIIPMSKIEFTSFYDSFMDKYSFPYVGKPVFPSYLWKLD